LIKYRNLYSWAKSEVAGIRLSQVARAQSKQNRNSIITDA